MGTAYLEHLTDDDLELLSASHRQATGETLAVGELRSRSGAIEDLLARPEVFEAVFGVEKGADPFWRGSPFLVFAVAVHRCSEDLQKAAFVPEWLGPRQRVAVFDVEALRDFLAEPSRRFFLVELLASYTHVASGSVWVQTRRGWRRRRFSELDPVRLASLLEVVPESERVGIYRRLGDLALFLTGVFPDHTAVRAMAPIDAARLLRAARLATTSDGGGGPGGRRDPVAPAGAVGLLEHLGRRWYRLACDSTASPTGAMRVVGEVSERFRQARRVLNLVTDRHLFVLRDRWFSPPTG
jgi:hypothetical protein